MPTPSTPPAASAPASAPVLTVSADGTRTWRHHGNLHRDDGPAVEWADGDRWWYRHGHRVPCLLEHLLDAGLPPASAVKRDRWVSTGRAIEAVVAALPLATRHTIILRVLAQPASQGGVQATPDWVDLLLAWLGRGADAPAARATTRSRHR